ncbi:hypothetical protein JOB18_036999 [Solea senegalensis]|uniref:Lung adenoma susceptibility protein 2 n=1 Tax=Solea senegalensis TaxID=28829 RepID=A0AAV6R4N8_SOLSE|nr:lung adenoma susceptibility protein 2 [Solea senegalensis]KAG7499410.1 hypothetical protein JOB18_036999 [Solea senegalensis]
MEPDSPAGDFLSPESTVTSLLSSSGHLRSSLRVPEHTTTFRYRNKNYDSASAALDAYITDFDSSCQKCRSVTGRLVLPQSPSSTPSRLRESTLRNKDVLRESLTERELDFLNLPVSSLRHRVNRDRLSMTTDELLSIPYDGSLPVTHTSAFLQGLVSQSGASQLHCTPSCPGCRACSGLSSSHTDPRLNRHHHPQFIHRSRSSRVIGQSAAEKEFPVSSFKSTHRAAASQWEEPSVSHRPWSDLKCPAWIQDCDLSEPLPPSSESRLRDDNIHSVFPHVAARGGAPSWVAELEEEDESCSQVGSQLSLRDLRLQFAEQISQLAAERRSSGSMETLFRDNRIESLIQKADHVLNSLCQRREGAVSPVNTEDLLTSPSHRSSFPLNSAAAAGGSTEARSNRTAETPGYGLHGNSIWEQPGPVEALKQMLFRLQSVEAQLQQQEGEAAAAPTQPERLQTLDTPLKQMHEGEAELESFTGGPSLHRALHHLNRLKLLVGEPREKQQEEKDEDEGRFSASSNDGHVCARDKDS